MDQLEKNAGGCEKDVLDLFLFRSPSHDGVLTPCINCFCAYNSCQILSGPGL